MRQDPYDVVKSHNQCFMIFGNGLNGILLDVSMHHSEIINNEIIRKLLTMTYLDNLTHYSLCSLFSFSG